MKLLNGEWSDPFFFAIHIFVYSVILAIVAAIVALVIKYLGEMDIISTEEVATSAETDQLIGANNLPKYGTYNQEDVESGNNTKEYLDGESVNSEICIICYDRERNCFFVPCGHCAACQICADRIVNEDGKRCPVCRRLIGRVKKTFFPYQSKLGWVRTKVLGDLDGKSKSLDVS